jgi:hypothetical protein
VPVGDGEPEVVPHRPAFHERVGVVVPKGQQVLRRRSLVGDPADARKRLSTPRRSMSISISYIPGFGRRLPTPSFRSECV